jgi:hypothetical protein
MKFLCVILFFIAFSANAQEPVLLLQKTLLKSDAKFAWHELRLTTKLTGEFTIWQRGPRESHTPLPVIFLLAGIESNQKSLDLLSDVNAHVFTLDYKIPVGGKIEEVVAGVAKRFLQIQAEYLAAIFWLMQNSDQYDFSRFSSVNISFGTFVAPMPLRLAAKLNIYPRATVFAFGGADVKNFILPYLVTIEDDALRERAKEIIENVFDEIDSSRHLRHLQGPFLVIRAANDEVIPKSSSDALEKALPGLDKTLVVLDTAHIDVDQPEVISLARKATFEFLRGKGAL